MASNPTEEQTDQLFQLHLQERQAQVRKINAEAALLEGQAQHEQALARNLDSQTRMQLFNVEVMAPVQAEMQQNTLRMQTAQVNAEAKKTGLSLS